MEMGPKIILGFRAWIPRTGVPSFKFESVCVCVCVCVEREIKTEKADVSYHLSILQGLINTHTCPWIPPPHRKQRVFSFHYSFLCSPWFSCTKRVVKNPSIHRSIPHFYAGVCSIPVLVCSGSLFFFAGKHQAPRKGSSFFFCVEITCICRKGLRRGRVAS